MRVALASLLFFMACGGPPIDAVLDVAITTSTRDSGLFEVLLPEFQERTGLEVRLVAVGSGAALRMGADGEVDVLVTHAPEGEQKLVAEGKLVDRTPFMRNWFVLAGPREDPAGVRAAANAADALLRIAAAGAPFVSRADDSGTHRREKALLTAAGLDPAAGWPGVERTNAGMGQSLQVAGERRAYILADVGTYEAFRERIDLSVFSDRDDPQLANVYSVSRPAPAAGRELNVDGAEKFAAYLSSPDTQRKIAAFKGGGLFVALLLDESGP